MLGTTFMLMFMTVISKIIGLVREQVMSNYYGTGDIKAIYIIANTIPVVISNFIADGIASGFIPIYNKAKNEKGVEKAEDFTSNIFNILMVFATIVVILGVIFAKGLSNFVAWGDLKGESIEVAGKFTRIIMFAIYAYLYSSIFRGYLNLKGNFKIPVTTGIIMNLVIITFTVISGKSGNPYYLARGCLLGNVFQYTFFPKAAKNLGYKHKRGIDIHDEYVKAIFLIAIPVIISSAAGEITILVDNGMASYFFGKEKITVLNYAKLVLAMVSGIITVSVTTSSYPTIAALGQKGKYEEMKMTINKAMVNAMGLVIPATIGIMVLSNPIVSLAFERGKFTAEDSALVASILVAYGPYVVFQSVTDIVDRGFYAVGNSMTPVKIVLVQQLLNVGFNYIFVKIFGLHGLAYATALSTAIGSMIMLITFRKHFGQMNFKNSLKSITKIALVALFMGFVVNRSYLFMAGKISKLASLLLAILIGLIVYFLVIIFMRIPEVMHFVNRLYHKINKKQN